MSLTVQNLHKSYGGTPVLQNVSLSLAPQETLAILGQSGSGKTTLLKVIAGLEAEDAGTMAFNGQPLNGVPPQQRGIVYLYQEPLLFPHLNAFQNIAFGLKLQKLPKAEVQQRTQAMLESLGIPEQARKMPHQLSGGQRQRVAFGRALIIQPRLLLLDEPFSALDAKTRSTLQQFYKQLARQHQISTLLVTHDVKEAITMGQRVGTMQQGQLRCYPSIAEFVNDPTTGVAQEIEFWKSLGQPEA